MTIDQTGLRVAGMWLAGAALLLAVARFPWTSSPRPRSGSRNAQAGRSPIGD